MEEGGRAGKGREQTWHLGSIFVSSGVAQQSNKWINVDIFSGKKEIDFCVSGRQVGGNES